MAALLRYQPACLSLVLACRAIAGVGAATLGIGSSYVTQTTTSARRQVGALVLWRPGPLLQMPGCLDGWLGGWHHASQPSPPPKPW